MNREDLQEALQTLRKVGTDVEDALGVSGAEISRWERGAARVPRVRARQLRWLLQVNENKERRAAAELPRCAWDEALTQRWKDRFAAAVKSGSVLEVTEAYSAEVDGHRKECPTCRANDEWERRHLRDPGPFPMPGVMGAVMGAFARVPQPFHFALLGGLFLGGIVALRLPFLVVFMVIRFPGIGESLRLLGGGVLTVLAASAAGAAGGLVIPLTAPLRRSLGVVGEYLTGVLVLEAYVWSIAWLMSVVLGDAVADVLGSWKFVTAYAGAFGLFGAFIHRRNQRKEAAKRHGA